MEERCYSLPDGNSCHCLYALGEMVLGTRDCLESKWQRNTGDGTQLTSRWRLIRLMAVTSPDLKTTTQTNTQMTVAS